METVKADQETIQIDYGKNESIEVIIPGYRVCLLAQSFIIHHQHKLLILRDNQHKTVGVFREWAGVSLSDHLP